jgi:hypothetical protein
LFGCFPHNGIRDYIFDNNTSRSNVPNDAEVWQFTWSRQ